MVSPIVIRSMKQVELIVQAVVIDYPMPIKRGVFCVLVTYLTCFYKFREYIIISF